jgi:DNA-binding transcriptional regulator YiaG
MSLEQDTLPEGYDFTSLYRKRVANDQDLAVLVTDSSNSRGTGKTVLSLKLARLLDRTETGITEDNVAISPDELIDAYTQLPRGSSLVLDEAEAGLSKYRAGSAVNMAMRELVSMGRIEQKYLILNLPASGELDRDLKALCDFWFMVQYRGRALGHHLNWNPYREEPRTPVTDPWEWSDIPDGTDLRDVYDYLTEQKQAHLRGESKDSSQRLTQEQVRDRIDQAQNKAKTKERNQVLNQIYSNLDVTQSELASSIGLSRSRVADIVSRDN